MLANEVLGKGAAECGKPMVRIAALIESQNPLAKQFLCIFLYLDEGGVFMVMQESVLEEYWIKFAETGEIDSHVRDYIAASWLRCKAIGLDMYENTINRIATGEDLAMILENNSDLIKVAEPVMKYLWSVLKGTSAVITLSDGAYNLLLMTGDEITIKRFEKSNFCIGAHWSEDQVGTNSLALCIDMDCPIQTASVEQYGRWQHSATGSGAPIHDENGAIIGSINLTSDMNIFSNYSLGMVTAAAKLIEEQITLLNANKLITYGIDAMSEGMIITDGTFKIKTINEQGRMILEDVHDKLIGRDLREIIVGSLGLEKEHGKFEEIAFSIDGKTVFCMGRINKMIFNNSTMGVSVVFRTTKRMNQVMAMYAGSRASYSFDDIKTGAPNMLRLIEQTKNIAREDCNILILGASGTGKELFAQAVHNASLRSKGPFVAVNCAALPKDLVESELFGYEGGAFTGAKKEGMIGKFELANGGTILLDEIGEMPLDAQGKLLRVLEERKISRIGGKTDRNIDVRIITATNRNLKEEVGKNTFRLDLFYRINVVSIEVPRLNDRPGDIKLLANLFLDRLNKEGHKQKRFDENFVKYLENYQWVGNVRELQNVISKAFYICDGALITECELPDDIRNISLKNSTGDSYGIIDNMEKNIIIDTIIKNKGNITRSAKDLGMSKPTLYRKIKKYGIVTENLK